MARSRRRQQPAKEHPSHLTRAWRWWNGLELQGKLGILGLVVAVVAAIPSFIALRSSPPRATTSAATTSTRQPSQGPALRLNATYDRDPVSVMWAVPGTLAPDEEPIITAPNLVGNDAAQARIDKLLLQHNGVKIETDQTGNERPHAKLRVVATGQHDPPVLITGLRAAVLRRQPPLYQTLIYAPPQGEGENIQVGLDLDVRAPTARSFDNLGRLAAPYFATHHVLVKAGEQVVFTIRAFTSKCYCEWELLVTAIVDGKEQVFRVRDGDRPFRTTAFATRYDTVYSFNFFTGRFVKLPPETKFPPPEFGP